MFVLTLAAYIDSMQSQKWNDEQVIIFQTVILQRVCLVTGTKNICAQICDEINSWNSGVSDNLVFYYYATDTGYLGTAHRNQRADRYHHTFSNLVIPGKLCESVRFIC